MDKIIIENLHKKINDFTLDGVSFTVHSGEIFALVGMAGSGKSTVTKILHNLSSPDGGKIHFNKFSTGVLVQEQEFYKNKTILQTMVMFAKMNLKFIARSDIRNTLRAVGLFKRRNMQIKYLNLNRYSRLKIALAIMGRPAILILDDPFAYLSEFEAREVRVILKTLAEKFNTAILLTATDFAGIEEIFDTAAIIEGGRIVCIESYNNLCKRTDREAKICIATPSPNFAATEITEHFKYETNLYGDNEVIINAHPEKANEIHEYLLTKDIEVTSVTRVNKSIAGLFHSLRTREVT